MSASIERRSGQDRRQRLWLGVFAAHWLRRRKSGRRTADAHPVARDVHPAHWLVVALLVLLLSVADAFLTLNLIYQHGAQELNPVLAPLVQGGSPAFAWWKLGLTAFGVLVLIQLTHVRLFGVIPAGCLLYLVLIGYLILIPYEWHLLQHQAVDFVYSGRAIP